MAETSSAANGLTCQELVELVTDYIENTLPEREKARVEAHLALCTGCDRYVEQMRQTIQALGVLQEKDLAPDVQEKLLNAFRNWRGG